MNTWDIFILTILSLQSCPLYPNVIQLSHIFSIFALQLTQLILKSAAHFLQICLKLKKVMLIQSKS